MLSGSWFSRALCAVALVASASSVAHADPAIAKGPWLQAVGPTRATIKLELDTPAKIDAEVTGPGGFHRVVTGEAVSAFHALHVDGLSPATRYEYKVGAVSGAFTTAPTDDRPFRFVVYGDSRSDVEAHAAVIRAIREARADFLVNTGDMVGRGDDPDEWKGFFDVEEPILRDTCVFACIGNHELAGGSAGATAFLRYFGDPDGDGADRDRLYASVRWGNTRFFLLNAMDEWTGEERAWLASALDQAASEPGIVHRIAVLHHGPFSSGPHGGNPRLADGGVVAMMRDRGVDLVLAGHDHIYERGEGQGLKYVISGGAGAPLYERTRRAPETITFEPVHHYVTVSVDHDQVRLVATRASGSVIESCGFRGKGPWECDGQAAKAASPASTSVPAAPTKAPPAPPPHVSSCLCSTPGGAGGSAPGGALALAVTAVAVLRRRAGGRDHRAPTSPRASKGA